MATPVQNLNGIFLRDTIYNPGSHLDSYHLMDMMKNAKPTDLGIIEYWSQTQQAATPLYTLSSFGGKNVIYVDDPQGRYAWQTPIVNDMPHITRDVDPTTTTKGKDGGTFQIALNRRAFGHTDIISYDKMSGLEMRVTETDIIDMGNNEYVYTVQLMNNDNTAYLDNKYLVPQTSFFRKSSARGEYGERYADINVRAGLREYYNFVGNSEANVYYSVSSRAEAMMKNGRKMPAVPIREIWQIRDNDKRDPSIVSIPDAATRLGEAGMIKAMQEGWITKTFVTALEQAGITKITEDVENYLMWGLGGRVRQDGADDIRLTVGLWRQLDNSFKRVYNIGTFTPDVIESELYNFYRGRVDFTGPDPKRKVIVQTGIAGMRQMNNAIKNMAINSGLVQNASEIGAISGGALDLDFGYAFTSYTIPFLANVKFVINPALDPILANDIENPMVNGYRTSSYCYIIWDITDSGSDNIFLMKKSTDDEEFSWRYINGTCDYKGNTKGFQSSGNFNGYQLYMNMAHKAVQVKDPTKVLKIVPYNIVTGRAFGS